MRGVVSARVDGCKGEVVVVRKAGTASDRDLVFALTMIGYTAKVLPIEEAVLRVSALERKECRDRVCKALGRVCGVRKVSLKGRARATVTFDGRRVRPPDLVKAVERAGFGAQLEG